MSPSRSREFARVLAGGAEAHIAASDMYGGHSCTVDSRRALEVDRGRRRSAPGPASIRRACSPSATGRTTASSSTRPPSRVVPADAHPEARCRADYVVGSARDGGWARGPRLRVSTATRAAAPGSRSSTTPSQPATRNGPDTTSPARARWVPMQHPTAQAVDLGDSEPVRFRTTTNVRTASPGPDAVRRAERRVRARAQISTCCLAQRDEVAREREDRAGVARVGARRCTPWCRRAGATASTPGSVNPPPGASRQCIGVRIASRPAYAGQYLTPSGSRSCSRATATSPRPISSPW